MIEHVTRPLLLPRGAMRALLVAGLMLAAVTPVLAAADRSALLQLVDYVGVDYGGAVRAGEVIDAGEYAEMREFGARIVAGAAALPEGPQKRALAVQAESLSRLIDGKASPAAVADLTRDLRDGLMLAYPVAVTPRRAPDLEGARVLYQQGCAACHGSLGLGDGPAAAWLDPPPADFHDRTRAQQRSVYGLYNTITLGVAGTSMPSYSYLPDDDRWALAFYVGALFADDAMLAAGAAAWQEDGPLSLHEAVTRAPAELLPSHPRAVELAAFGRRQPQPLFAGRPDPLRVALDRLETSTAAYRAGDRAGAESFAVAAYLDGFELAEGGLGGVAPGLVRAVEDSMMAFRGALEAGAPVAEVERREGELRELLLRAQGALEEKSLAGGVAFTSSLVILLREGLEAILVLAAIVAFLVRSGQRRAIVYVHLGWIAALVAGAGTWAAATWAIDISGAAREVTEGVTALLAAVILFYVGFWMHQSLNARRWNRLVQDRMRRALQGRTLLGLSVVSFVAVYREIFETVLFYQALWPQVRTGAQGALLAGVLVAAVALVAVAWSIFVLGVKLPLRQFFAISGGVTFVLAVVLAGKGIVALQEAGTIPISPIHFPRVELLGVYPTLQSVAAQLALSLAALTLVWWSRRAQPAVSGP